MPSQRANQDIIVSSISGVATAASVATLLEEFDALRGAPIWVIDATGVPDTTDAGLDESFSMLNGAQALGLEVLVVAVSHASVRMNSAAVGSAVGLDLRVVGDRAAALALAEDLRRIR